MSFDLERTVSGTHDLDWLPPHLKAVRWAVAGTVWTGLGGALAAMIALTKGHVFFVWGKGIGAVAIGGYYAGDRAARAILRRRLGRIARGATDLRHLAREADGEVLHVRGRVRARTTVPAFLDGEPAVYRRLTLSIGGLRVVHEAACDFSLVDETGELVTVLVDGARLLCSDPKRHPLDEHLLSEVAALPLPERFGKALAASEVRRNKGKRREDVRATEVLVRNGDTVEIVGYKTRVVDPSVQVMERETPMRATLRSGHELPLLISPVADAAR